MKMVNIEAAGLDRLLIARAVTMPARLVTADPLLPPCSDVIDLVS